MAARLFYLLVTVLFVTMNVLLWRADISGRADFGSQISPRLVWEKVLTAAGESSLEVRYKGAKVGTARWQPTISETATPGNELDMDLPEGMVEHVSNYQLEFDGNCTIEDFVRLRFGLHLKLSTNYDWQEFSMRISLKPHLLEINASAAEQVLRVRLEDEEGVRNFRYTFADLKNPDKIMAELGQPWLPGALLALGVPLSQRSVERSGLGIKWQARNDSMTVQHVHIRGYQLKAKLLDRHPISIFINPAGEILRIDLPGDVVLLSDALINL